MPWAVAGAAVAAAGSVASSSISANAAGKAGKKALGQQNAALGEASQHENDVYNQSRADLQPYAKTGNRALSLYESILTGTPLNQAAAYDAGFSTNGTNLNTSVLGSLPAALKNAIQSRTIKSPGFSDFSDGTYMKLVNELASADPSAYASKISSYGMPAGIDQQQWKDALAGMNNPNSTFDPAATSGGYGLAQGGGQALGGTSGGGQYDAFFNSPDYQFTQSQGLKALDNAGSGSQRNTGAQQKAIERFGQGLGATQYNNFMNRLSGLATQGQNAASGQASVANNVGSTIAQSGNNAANATIGSNNANAGTGAALGQGLGLVGSALGSMSGSGGSAGSGVGQWFGNLFGGSGSNNVGTYGQ